MIWLIMVLIGAILFTDIKIGMATTGMVSKVMKFSSSLLVVPFSFFLLYIFPAQAKFENKIKDNFKNAALMSIGIFGYTLLMLLITTTFVMFLLYSRVFIGLFLVCGVGLLAYLLSGIFVIVLHKYLPDEYDENIETNGIDDSKK